MTQRLPDSTHKLEFQQLAPRSGLHPASDLTQTRLPNRFCALLDHKGMTSRRYCIPCRWTDLGHYICHYARAAKKRRLHRFTITWAQFIVKFRIGWIVKIFQIRYTLTMHLSRQSSEGNPIRSDSGSFFSPMSLPVALKDLLCWI